MLRVNVIELLFGHRTCFFVAGVCAALMALAIDGGSPIVALGYAAFIALVVTFANHVFYNSLQKFAETFYNKGKEESGKQKKGAHLDTFQLPVTTEQPSKKKEFH